MGEFIGTVSERRFKVAFSFAGEKRGFVAQVADILAHELGRPAVLYDEFHKVELARPDLGIYLPKLYHDEAELVVVVACENYNEKEWTGLEWLAIHDLIKKKRYDRILLSRFGFVDPEGLYSNSGYVPLDELSPEQFAQDILERLRQLEPPIENKIQAKRNSAKLWMLPNQPTPYFTGQIHVLDEIHTKLQVGKVSLTQAVSLVAEGGIGKTELALQYCQKHQNDYAHIFWFSGRDRAALQTDLARACVSLFGTKPEEEGQPSIGLQRAVRMRDQLSSLENCLVVLDNVDDLEALQAEDKTAAEEVGADVAFIDHLLKLAGPRVLITSRKDNWGRLAAKIAVHKLKEDDGALLFLKRALERPEVESLSAFEAKDQGAARDFTKEVDGFQLALEQAGATAAANGWSPARYLAEFQKRFAELTQDKGDDQGIVHDPIFTTVKLSLEAIDAKSGPAGQLVRWCAYLPPDWIPEEIFRVEEGRVFESLQGESIEELIRKVRGQSLLHIDSEHDVFTMHRLIQRIVRMINSGSEVGSEDLYEALAIAADLADPGQEYEHWSGRDRLVPIWRYLAERTPESEPLIRCLFNIADHGFRAQRGLGVLADAERGQELATNLLQNDADFRSTIAGTLGSVYGALGRHEDALKIKEEVLLWSEILGPRHLDRVLAMNNLAHTYWDLGRHDDALKLQEEVLELRSEILGPRHPGTVTAMNNLASTYWALGRHQDALKLQEETMELWLEILGPRHPDTVMAMNNLAHTYGALGRHDDALKLQDETLELRSEILGPRHPDTVLAMSNLAHTYGNLGRHEDALKLKEEVLELWSEVLGLRHPDTLLAMNNLAGTYGDLGRHDDALKLQEESLELQSEILGPHHPDTARAKHNLAVTYWDIDRLTEAVDLERQAFSGLVEALGRNHPNTQIVLEWFLYMLTARPDLALPGELESLKNDG